MSLQFTWVVDGRMPRSAIFEPLYILAIMSLKAAGDPLISRPTSNPTIPSSFLTSAIEVFIGFTALVAPIFLAMSSLYSLISVTTICLAPAKRQIATAIDPIRPAPVISTSSPMTGKERAVCDALPKGSIMAI